MKLKVGFFTGARSDYGIMKNLIKLVKESNLFEEMLYVSGIHLLNSFGNTVKEIENDGNVNFTTIKAFKENTNPGFKEFSKIINKLSESLQSNPPDIMFLLGDRIETYAAALACHFSEIPILHSGGGTLTNGANDNIYRYNISNLATYHFATSKKNYERLLNLPITDNKNVFFTGSFAIDAIIKFKNNPVSIQKFIPELKTENFCLITFHSATKSKEDIAGIMDDGIKKILSHGKQVLVTYPNNDPGYKDIIKVIDEYRNVKNVYIIEHLGAVGYYAALNDCFLVLGNSSSGIIEAPYFNKRVINIGQRQEGRETDETVITLPSDNDTVLKVLESCLNSNEFSIPTNNIYGDGNSLLKINDILNNLIYKELQ